MARKQTAWKTKGMNRDLSVSAFNPEFSYENKNLRLNTNNGNTLLSWVTEKGTLEMTLAIDIKFWTDNSTRVNYISGIPIGTAVINGKLVLFTSNEGVAYDTVHYTTYGTMDNIYVLECTDDHYVHDPNGTYMYGKLIYSGDLNFNARYPLETLVSYENEHIQKVYWTDGLNQPRFINIAADDEILAKWCESGSSPDTFFDFVPAVEYEHFTVSVVKAPSSSGLFAPGVIQYCMTYSNDNGQESNVVWASDLLYIAHLDRGASPEEKVNTSYKITVDAPDYRHFDNIRIYSIQRTSLDTEPFVKLLTTIRIKDLSYNSSTHDYSGSYIDNGTMGSVVDPYVLLYVGGKEIKALTMTEKDNTLFLGNFEEKNLYVEDIQDFFDSIRDPQSPLIEYNRNKPSKSVPIPQSYELYKYDIQLGKSQEAITTFKGGETYRFGIQLQRKTGEWTYPIFIEDVTNTLYPSVSGTNTMLVQATAQLPTGDLQAYLEGLSKGSLLNEFSMVRPVIVYPTVNDRTILCQGVITPTVFNALDRIGNSPYAQASWFFRPYMQTDEHSTDTSASVIHGTVLTEGKTKEQYEEDGQFVPDFIGDDYHEVYILVADINKAEISSVIAKRSLKFTATTTNLNTGETGYTSASIPFLGIINLGDSNLFIADHSQVAFIFDIPDPLPASSSTADYSTTITWDELRTWTYDDISFKLYWDMLVDENKMLYYHNSTNNPSYNTYIFEFHAGNTRYRVPFNSLDATPSSIYQAITGNSLKFTHYDSLFTTDSLADAGCSGDWEKIEIQGSVKRFNTPYSAENDNKNSNTQFFVDQSIQTFHSPDIEFDTNVQVYGTDNLKLRIIGAIPITSSVSSGRITAGSKLEAKHNLSPTEYIYGSGDLEKKLLKTGSPNNAAQRTVAQYLWNDVLVSEDTSKEDKVVTSDSPYDFLVYPWQRTGSLNNDWRTEDTASSWLKTNKRSTMLFSKQTLYSSIKDFGDVDAKMFFTENDYILNMRLPSRSYDAPNGINYYPNISKILYNGEGFYTKYKSTYTKETKKLNSPISMKYKSTSHAVVSFRQDPTSSNYIPIPPEYYNSVSSKYIGRYTQNTDSSKKVFWNNSLHPYFTQASITNSTINLDGSDFLWLAELYKTISSETRFGGTTKEALMSNSWVVAGEAEPLYVGDVGMSLTWSYGDTYYQRYDCMKTYPFTKEDSNQIVEILSFMCETHVNIDGRYDKNRGQIDNYNFDPTVFNLLNPVYSQQNNFFQNRIIDLPNKEWLAYPNSIYYSKTKQPGAEIDAYTNVTLATTLSLDGDKGKISDLERFNNEIIAFQDTGISQILYNENMQISTTQGVPIEIANSGKVNGKRYLSDTIGCSNKWSIANTPNGIYFMDSHEKDIYLFNGKLSNLSVEKGFSSWCKQNINFGVWKPYNFHKSDVENHFIARYDKNNKEVMFINEKTCLSFSEIIGTFTSFYDYNGAAYFNNIENYGLWIKQYDSNTRAITYPRCSLYKHQEGDYCNFFGENKPYWMTLIGNPEPQIDKIFTNLEFRACVDGDGELSQSTGRFSFALPFNSLEVWDEYQHGLAYLEDKSGHSSFMHNLVDKTAALKRKFRIWRCDIPRDNVDIVTTEPVLPDNPTEEQQAAYDAALIKYNQYLADEGNHIYRTMARPIDRMRNPWVYLKLFKNAASTGNTLPRAQIHDMIMTYFG